MIRNCWSKKGIAKVLTLALVGCALFAHGGRAQQQPADQMVNLPVGPVVSHRGMVAAAHPLAAQVGLRILQEGGNAFDAAVATTIAVGVLESEQTDGLTGEGFGLLYTAKTGELKALDWGTRTPLSPEFAKRVAEIREQDSPVNLIPPGAIAGMGEILRTLGTKSLAQVLAPSIEYAEKGVPVREPLRRAIQNRAEVFRKDPLAASVFLPNGQVPAVGDLLRFPDLARTMRTIAAQGPDVVYRGEVSREILAWVKQVGGLLTGQDMELASKPAWVTPLSTTYHGYTIKAVPPAAGGMPLVEVMNILEGFKLREMSEAERTHVVAETFKISLTDMETYFGDPEAVKARGTQILSKKSAEQRRAEIRLDRAMPWTVAPADPVGGTTHLVVADSEGNVASITNTRSGWGIGRPAGRTGLFLHDGTRLLSTNPKSTMFAKPGKRLQKSITPVMVFDSQQRLILALGAAGGRTITHTNAQLLVNVLDLGMNPQQAISAPRVAYAAAGRKLIVSRRFSPQTLEALRKLGHELEFGESGVAQAIAIDPRARSYIGGADPRQHGGVAAY